MNSKSKFFLVHSDPTWLTDGERGGPGKGKAKLNPADEALGRNDGHGAEVGYEVHNPPGDAAAAARNPPPGGLSSLIHSQPADFTSLPDHPVGVNDHSQVNGATGESSESSQEISDLAWVNSLLFDDDETGDNDEPRADGVQEDGAQGDGAEQAGAKGVYIDHAQRRQAFMEIIELGRTSPLWQNITNNVLECVSHESAHMEEKARNHRVYLCDIAEQSPTKVLKLKSYVNQIEKIGSSSSLPSDDCRVLKGIATGLTKWSSGYEKDMRTIKYRGTDVQKAILDWTSRLTLNLSSLMATLKGSNIPVEAFLEYLFEDTPQDIYADLVAGKVGRSDGSGSSSDPPPHPVVSSGPVRPSGGASSSSTSRTLSVAPSGIGRHSDGADSSSPQPISTPQSGVGRASDGAGSSLNLQPLPFSPTGTGTFSYGAGSSYSQPSPAFLPVGRSYGVGSTPNSQPYPFPPNGNFPVLVGASSSCSEPSPTLPHETVRRWGGAGNPSNLPSNQSLLYSQTGDGGRFPDFPNSSWSPQFGFNSPTGTASNWDGGLSSSNSQLFESHLDGADNDLYSQLFRSLSTDNVEPANRADNSPNPEPYGSNTTR